MPPFLTLAALLVAAPAAPSTVASPPAATSEDCLACHAGEAQREDGRSVSVDAARLAASVHGQAGVACADCHTAAGAELPHPPRLAGPDCAACHAETVSAHAAGAHGAVDAAGRVRASCADCHGAHDILAATDPGSRTNPFNVPRTCARCHGDAGGRAPGGPALVAAYADSIHGRALSRAGLVVAPNCATCHGSHDVRGKADPASRISHANVPQTCGKCHAGILPVYAESVHGRALAAGKAAAACTDCHTAHSIRAADVPAWRLDVIRECGACHKESIRTYRDSFHGKVTQLGYSRVATCADCHGSHDIQRVSDPRSTVSAARRVQTCTRCHTGATASFARYDPHADPEDGKSGWLLHAVDTSMEVLLAAVFGFFAIHTGLWFPRELLSRRRRPPPASPPRAPAAESSPAPSVPESDDGKPRS